MKFSVDLIIRHFLRTHLQPFSARDFSLAFLKFGEKISIEEAVALLETDANVFALADDTYITKAGSFTNQYFSFKPTRKEISKGAFVVGDRCVPFADAEIPSFKLDFLYKGKILEKKVIEYDSNSAMEFFTLFGTEYASQYVASDPVNSNINLSQTEFDLPYKIKLTANSIDEIIKSENFSYGDRFLCHVENWDEGIIEIEVIHHEGSPTQMNMEDLEREQWYTVLENALLESFDIIGPCSSMEEQLSLVFAENMEKLSVKNCGSISEFFMRSKKVGYEIFGVETRIWRKNEEIPAIGQWNQDTLDETEYAVKNCKLIDMLQIPSYIEDAALKNMIYNNSDDFNAVFEDLYPFHHYCNKNQRAQMLLHLKNRRDILLKSYSRFVDFEVAPVRQQALELFYIINELVCAIDYSGTKLDLYPQQSLVVLSQLFGHVSQMIESMGFRGLQTKELDEMSFSIEGMSYNFEGIRDSLKNVIERETRNSFSVIK